MRICNAVREICPILSTWSRTATVQDLKQCEYVYDHVFWLRHEHYQERYVGIRDQGYELYFDRQKLRLVNPTPRSIWALDRWWWKGEQMAKDLLEEGTSLERKVCGAALTASIGFQLAEQACRLLLVLYCPQLGAIVYLIRTMVGPLELMRGAMVRALRYGVGLGELACWSRL